MPGRSWLDANADLLNGGGSHVGAISSTWMSLDIGLNDLQKGELSLYLVSDKCLDWCNEVAAYNRVIQPCMC